MESLKEQLWEMDTSNRNNLVFYGVKEEADTPDTLVKEVIRRSDCCCDVYYVIFIEAVLWKTPNNTISSHTIRFYIL